MRVTIVIEVSKRQGIESFADEVVSLLPNTAKVKELREDIVSAILPVTFRLIDNQKQKSYIQFDHKGAEHVPVRTDRI